MARKTMRTFPKKKSWADSRNYADTLRDQLVRARCAGDVRRVERLERELRSLGRTP